MRKNRSTRLTIHGTEFRFKRIEIPGPSECLSFFRERLIKKPPRTHDTKIRKRKKRKLFHNLVLLVPWWRVSAHSDCVRCDNGFGFAASGIWRRLSGLQIKNSSVGVAGLTVNLCIYFVLQSSLRYVRIPFMRAAAINFNLNLVQCPFCRSQAEKVSSLIVCSDCRTIYHRECWKQNKGCSVFGCDGTMNDLKKRRGEPGWLIALRILVFGFILLSFMSLWFVHSSFVDILFIVWAMVFMVAAPVLLITEIICLFQVTENPEMRAKYGRPVYHILSLSGYGIIIFLFFLSMFLLPFMI